MKEIFTKGWGPVFLVAAIFCLFTAPALAAAENPTTYTGVAMLKPGLGDCQVSVEGVSHTLQLEYASAFSTNSEGLPLVLFHFRWYPGTLQNQGGTNVLIPERDFDRVLRNAPVLRWQVYSGGQAVGWFTAKFEGVVPVNAGQWGIGLERRWPGWSTLFTSSKEGGALSPEKVREWVEAGIELRYPEMLEAHFGKPLIQTAGGSLGSPSPARNSSSLDSTRSILDSMDRTWEKVEDRKNGVQ